MQKQYFYEKDLKLMICYPDKTDAIDFTEQLLSLTIKQVPDYFKNIIRYSTRIYLYTYPVHPFSSLEYLDQNLTLRQIVKYFPFLAITFNNTQYIQEKQLTGNIRSLNSYIKFNENQFAMILQICQRNAFVDESYKLSKNSQFSFLHNISNRFGSQIFIQYYSFRVPLKDFNKKELISDSVYCLLDNDGNLTLTVSSIVDNTLIKTIPGDLIYDKEKYCQMIIENHEVRYCVDRRCTIMAINFVLETILKTNILYNIAQNKSEQIQSQHIFFFALNNYKPINKLNKITLQTVQTIYIKHQAQRFYPIQQLKLKNVLFLGLKENKLFFIQQSHILHIFKAQKPFKLIQSIFLPCPQTQNNDEDLAYLKDNNLILYSITIKFINLNFFDLKGRLLFRKQFLWSQMLYEIEFSVIDIFCVKLKPFYDKVRVFYPEDINNFYQIDRCTRQSMFFPSKKGCNTFSDRSGIFSIASQYCQNIRIFNFNTKSCLMQITFQEKIIFKTIFFSHSKTIIQQIIKIIAVQIDSKILLFNFNQNFEEIKKLQSSKAIQQLKIPQNFIKNSDIFFNTSTEVIISKQSLYLTLNLRNLRIEKQRIHQNCLLKFSDQSKNQGKIQQKMIQEKINNIQSENIFATKSNLIMSKNIVGVFLL